MSCKIVPIMSPDIKPFWGMDLVSGGQNRIVETHKEGRVSQIRNISFSFHCVTCRTWMIVKFLNVTWFLSYN